MMALRTQASQRGATMVEFCLIAPVLLLVGLGLVQIGMVYHAKSALNFALLEAARSGAAGNAAPSSIRNGFLRGLVPYMGGGMNAADIAVSLANATQQFTFGSAAGWIKVQQISPSPQSFSDWQENSFDDSGNAVVEIPNANLPVLRCTRVPSGGTAGYRTSTACGGSGEPVGTNSQQTLADANLLKLKVMYGVQVGVPIINRIIVKALAMAAGCQTPAQQQLGLVNLGTPTVAGADPSACAAYNAIDLQGNSDPRIPVSLAITVRMQSPARSDATATWLDVAARTATANTSGVQLGNGTLDPASQFAPLPVAQLNPNGVTQANDTLNATGVGSTHIGDPNMTETLGDPGPPITCTGH